MFKVIFLSRLKVFFGLVCKFLRVLSPLGLEKQGCACSRLRVSVASGDRRPLRGLKGRSCPYWAILSTIFCLKREVAGGSSGFGVVLWAETKRGVFYTAEACSTADGDVVTSHAPIVPSELGFEAASRLLDQVICISFTKYLSFAITNLLLSFFTFKLHANVALSVGYQVLFMLWYQCFILW